MRMQLNKKKRSLLWRERLASDAIAGAVTNLILAVTQTLVKQIQAL